MYYPRAAVNVQFKLLNKNIARFRSYSNFDSLPFLNSDFFNDNVFLRYFLSFAKALNIY